MVWFLVLGQTAPPGTRDIGAQYTVIYDHFDYKFVYCDGEGKTDITRSTGLNLKRKLFYKRTGVVSLLFEVVLAPSKAFE